MTRATHRFYCPDARTDADELALDKDQAHYVSRVLRLRTGAGVGLFDGHGQEFHAELAIHGKQDVRATNIRLADSLPEPLIELTLYQSIARGDRMDWALQKATELGVRHIQPVVAERTEVRLNASRLERRLSHWQGVVRAACEQCERAWLPVVEPPITVAQVVADTNADPEHPRFLSSLAANATKLGTLKAPKAASILVGPEGGLTSVEEQLLTHAGWQPISLGPRILRTETAGPSAIAMMQALWGDAR